jgi:hypothetical protein
MISANSVIVGKSHIMSFFVDKKLYYYDTYALDPKIDSNINFNFQQKGDNDDLLPIKSAFGGFAIYSLSRILGLNYIYQEDENGDPICEHVTFNRQISGKYINPKMIYPVLHH